MMMIANLNSDDSVDFIRKIIIYVDLKIINLADLNYLMIVIKYTEPKFIDSLFQIFHEQQINMEYINGNNMNVLDECIKMYHLCNSCNCDMYYFNLASSLRDKYNIISVKYPKINDIKEIITPWILLNIDNINNSPESSILIHYDESTYQIAPDNTSIINISNYNNDNIILYYEKIKGKIDNSIDTFTSLTEDELYYGLQILLSESNLPKSLSKNTTVSESYSNIVKNSKNTKIISDEIEIYNDLSIISLKTYNNQRYKFNKDKMPKCNTCKLSYNPNCFAILIPCMHSILCNSCAYSMKDKKRVSCVKCYRTVEHIIIK